MKHVKQLKYCFPPCIYPNIEKVLIYTLNNVLDQGLDGFIFKKYIKHI